ncbi:perilipin-5-like [Ornithodoros turicata]|uniref:perilipin-5-like n=1 Tax=Ornithodoros turicata TaxID=34597 RepID=UPI003139F068
MPEAKPAVQSQFVNRLASLPAVTSALDTAKQSYVHLKDFNGLLGYALDTAERSASFAVDQSKPLLEKFAGPLQYVDGLACKGLDKVEESFPLVKNPPEKIVAEAANFGRKKYDNAVEYGAAKLDSLKQYSSQTLHVLSHPRETISTAYTAYSTMVFDYTENALQAVEDGLTKHMQNLGIDSSTQNNQTSKDLRSRLGSLSSKAKVCLTEHAHQQVVHFNDSVAKLSQAIEVVQQMKAGLLNKEKSFQEVLRELGKNNAWLKTVLSDPDPNAPQTLSRQAYVVASNIVNQTNASLGNQFPVVKKLQDDLSSRIAVVIQKYTPHDDVTSLATAAVSKLKQQVDQVLKVTVQATDFAFSFLVYVPILDKFTSKSPSPNTSTDAVSDFETNSEESSE